MNSAAPFVQFEATNLKIYENDAFFNAGYNKPEAIYSTLMLTLKPFLILITKSGIHTTPPPAHIHMLEKRTHDDTHLTHGIYKTPY